MTEGPEDPHDDDVAAEVPGDRHTRRSWRIAGFGTLLVGGGLTILVAAGGAGGRAGLATVILGAAVSCASGALYATVTAAHDTYRRRDVPRGRVVAALVLFVLGAMLPGMLVAVGG